MLVISRRNGESLFIGDGVEVRVLAINGNQVRLGVEAPKHMPVYREELKERFQTTAERASSEETDVASAAAA